MKPRINSLLLALLPCAFLTSELCAQVVARYDAGLGDGPPPVAPNQYEFNGHAWTAVLNTNANVTVGPVSPDTPNCVNAWNVSDNSTSTGLGVSYSYPLSAAIHAAATSNGWELTLVSRVVTNFGTSTASAFIQFGNTNTQRRFLAHITSFSDGTLFLTLEGTNGGGFAFDRATNYHTHKIVYSAATGSATYYVDWQLKKSGWTGDYSPNAIDGLAFGCDSNSGKGSMNFNLVELGVQPPGPVATAFRYIQLGPFPQLVTFQWDAAVVNPGGPAIKEYVVYRNGLEIQRFLGTACSDEYLLPCRRYEYIVVAVDTNGVAHASSLPFTVTSLPKVPVIGVRNVKVLLLNFPDYPGEPLTTNDANDLVFNSTNSVRAYFQEISYGQLTLQGDTAGWFTMPQAASNYCSSVDISGVWYDCANAQLALDALSILPPDQTNNLSSYDNFIMIFHGYGPPGIAAGLYKLFGATTGFRMDVMVHELGHLMDVRGAERLRHAAGWSFCTGYPVGPDLFQPTIGCTVERYGDHYDAMAAANSYHFSMYHKDMLGFLQPTNIQVANQDGDYTLYAAEIVTNAVQMIKIPLEHEMFYFLEDRTPQGFDGPGTPAQNVPPIDGVLIRLRVSTIPNTDADTLSPNLVLNPGTPFIDPYRGLRVEVTQKLGNRVVVRISGTGKPLKITDLQMTGGNQDVRLTFDSVSGAKYRIQSSTNLQSWLTVQTNVLAGSASTTNLVPGAGAASGKMFRVGVDGGP